MDMMDALACKPGSRVYGTDFERTKSHVLYETIDKVSLCKVEGDQRNRVSKCDTCRASREFWNIDVAGRYPMHPESCDQVQEYCIAELNLRDCVAYQVEAKEGPYYEMMQTKSVVMRSMNNRLAAMD